MKEFHNIAIESQKLYQDLIVKQEVSINELKRDVLNLSSKDPYDNIRLLNEQSEDRIQSKIDYTGYLLLSASFISIIMSYFFSR